MRKRKGDVPAYTVEAVEEDGRLVDVRLVFQEGTRRLCGRGGPRLEQGLAERFLADDPEHGLPVLLGLGLGGGAALLRRRHPGPIVVADKEAAILALSKTPELAADPGVHWIAGGEPEEVVNALAALLEAGGRKRLVPLLHPVYARLDPGWYREIDARLRAMARFRDAVDYAKFAAPEPRVLLFDAPYFLTIEVKKALARLGAVVSAFPVKEEKRGTGRFVEDLLREVLAFRPDCILTINHLGFDREGALTGLLERLQLPLASWFVDNPHLILHDYEALASPWCKLFTWDADTVPSLLAAGFAHAAHLPLGTDAERFAPPAASFPPDHPWRADVSFVGASMASQARNPFRALALWPDLTRNHGEIAGAFAAEDGSSVREFLARRRPELYAAWKALPTREARLDYELLITWEATRRYRRGCVEKLMDFHPLIVGDAEWENAFPDCGRRWRRLDEIGYYEDLPRFYPLSKINFNCTSAQMKGAVNQRVFDVPACGAFLLTDHRRQLDALFEPGREVVCWRRPEEIPELVERFLRDAAGRAAVAKAARARVLAEHTYEHRLKTLLASMRETFGRA